LVTVYIVNRNYGRFLKQAIESALNQDYPALEVIVIDDASHDCSGQVLASYEHDVRVRIVRQASNRGLTACCNAAIRESTGELLMRLDADDYLVPSAVGTMVNALVGEPAAVLVFADFIEVDARGSIIRRVQRHDFSALEAMSDLPAHGACTLVRRSFVESFGGYDETINRQDGLDLWLNVGEGQRVLKIGEPLFCYRRHGHNLTRDECGLLRARAKLIAKHGVKRNLPRPQVLGVVPVRGQGADPESLPLRLLGDRPLIDWTVDEALLCEGLDRLVVSSPDELLLKHVEQRHGSRVARQHRSMDSAGLNVSLRETLSQVLATEARQGRRYDALMILTAESPFRSSMFMQQAIHIMQLFSADGVVCVRHEDEAFYRHDGLGLKPVRRNELLRMERDDLFRGCGGLRLVGLTPGDSATYLAGVERRPARLGHVLLDQRSAFGIRTEFDWEVAQHLVGTANSEADFD